LGLAKHWGGVALKKDFGVLQKRCFSQLVAFRHFFAGYSIFLVGLRHFRAQTCCAIEGCPRWAWKTWGRLS